MKFGFVLHSFWFLKLNWMVSNELEHKFEVSSQCGAFHIIFSKIQPKFSSIFSHLQTFFVVARLGEERKTWRKDHPYVSVNWTIFGFAWCSRNWNCRQILNIFHFSRFAGICGSSSEESRWNAESDVLGMCHSRQKRGKKNSYSIELLWDPLMDATSHN